MEILELKSKEMKIIERAYQQRGEGLSKSDDR